MGSETKIRWSRSSYNHWRGCTNITYGDDYQSACDICYAEILCEDRGLSVWGHKALRTLASPKYMKQPLQWAAQAKKEHQQGSNWPWHVFAFSLGDWADMEVPDQWRDQFFYDVVQPTVEDLTWILLTKRHATAGKYLESLNGWPWKNVIVGMTMEHQKAFDLRMPYLSDIPAYAKMISMEPLLGPIDIQDKYINDIDWVIVGGESGPLSGSDEESVSRRPVQPMHIGWVNRLKYWCKDNDKAFFFKQWGNYCPSIIRNMHELEDPRKTVILGWDGSVREIPEGQKPEVREFECVMHEYGKRYLDKANINALLSNELCYEWPDLINGGILRE